MTRLLLCLLLASCVPTDATDPFEDHLFCKGGDPNSPYEFCPTCNDCRQIGSCPMEGFDC